jgi:hypothetical protein
MPSSSRSSGPASVTQSRAVSTPPVRSVHPIDPSASLQPARPPRPSAVVVPIGRFSGLAAPQSGWRSGRPPERVEPTPGRSGHGCRASQWAVQPGWRRPSSGPTPACPVPSNRLSQTSVGKEYGRLGSQRGRSFWTPGHTPPQAPLPPRLDRCCRLLHSACGLRDHNRSPDTCRWCWRSSTPPAAISAPDASPTARPGERSSPPSWAPSVPAAQPDPSRKQADDTYRRR